MNLAYSLFLFSLLGVCALAVLRGGHHERLAAVALAAAALLSVLVVSHMWAGPELGVVLVDFALFAVLLWIAMRSTAFWPMWAAGFQLCALAVHIAAYKSPHMMPAAYAETLAIWAYPVMGALALGTLMETDANRGRS